MRKVLRNIVIGSIGVVGTEAWLQQPFACRPCRNVRRRVPLASVPSGDEDHLVSHPQSEARRAQEKILEELSWKGAEKIAKMDIPERAKRAMLAEAVEDRIFELSDILEALLEEDGSIKLENREKVQETAKQTKKLQQQYSDLVNGKPSAILTALASLGSQMSDS
jgi:hypothetical protein